MLVLSYAFWAGEAALTLFANSAAMQVSNIHIEKSANDGLSVIGGEPNLKNLIISNANGITLMFLEAGAVLRKM